MVFLTFVALIAALTGAIASVSAVGIGSILSPVVALKYDIKVAVAVVAIPHASAMLLRLIRLRRDLDYRVLFSFGLLNVAGALLGALLQAHTKTETLALVLGGVLVTAGVVGVTRWNERFKLGRTGCWIAGACSGAFGGLVGSQGPIRSAAMLGLGIRKEAFVATATAMGLAVDAVRLPVYFAAQGDRMIAAWPVMLIATGFVLAGTLAGEGVLHRLPHSIFKRAVSAIIASIGLLLLLRYH